MIALISYTMRGSMSKQNKLAKPEIAVHTRNMVSKYNTKPPYRFGDLLRQELEKLHALPARKRGNIPWCTPVQHLGELPCSSDYMNTVVLKG